MPLLPELSIKPSVVHPLTHPAFEGLDVIPYVRNRLVFAHVVAQALRTGEYAAVLVDLPSFMEAPGWLEAPLALLPHLSLAAFRAADRTHRAIVFSPSSPAAVAAAIARQTTTALCCIEDADTLNHPPQHLFSPRVRLPEDYRLYRLGLDGYFAPAWGQLAEAWETAEPSVRFFALRRGAEAARLTRAALLDGQRCLLVVEFQLWWLIGQALLANQPLPSYLFRWQTPAQAMLVLLDPMQAWMEELLDDYPAVALEFWRTCVRSEANTRPEHDSDPGNVIWLPTPARADRSAVPVRRVPAAAPFDKRATLDRMIELALSGTDTTTKTPLPAVAPRTALSFVSFLRRLMVITQRLVPQPASQLLKAAHAIGGAELARALRHVLFAYPLPPLRQSRRATSLGEFLCAYNGGRFGAHAHDRGELGSERAARFEVALAAGLDAGRRAGTEHLLEALTSSINFALRREYLMHAELCACARHLARHRAAPGRPRPSWGSLEGGIHWRATLSAFAQQDRRIHVRKRPRAPLASTHLNDWTPTVFLLAPQAEVDRCAIDAIIDANVTLNARNLGLDGFPYRTSPAPDRVYTVASALKSRRRRGGEHLREDTLSAIAFLHTSAKMGTDRYDAVNQRLPRYHCRVPPDLDSDFAGYPTAERLVAWAIKYAEQVVIVAAPDGWKPPPRLAHYAASRGVRLVTIPLSALPQHQLQRMGRMHFISRSLKRHPQRERILDQVVD